MPALIVITGKMFAGKDTFADKLVPLLPGATYRFTFSDLLREETQPGLDTYRFVSTTPIAFTPAERRILTVGAVAEALDLTGVHAEQFVAAFEAEPLTVTSMSDRTAATRFVLQEIGSTWRPRGYWPHKAIEVARAHLDAGSNVVMVGARFRDEFDLFRAAGAVTVRLDITEDAQVTRALHRDGLQPSLEALIHRGELELDDADFDVRIDTSVLDADQVLDEAVLALRDAGVDVQRPEVA